ncbi:GntR family transcriptional regulator [Balneicella halophila]|uniref:GntR family transcriptional regulator n=1 Tax=Balneicella halophila TaxID=1537566 RepID=A0A7L4UPJ1_BALHA|nr:GntR family transcriptional regulator [Balneicella halophila]PVX51028.1 GntR family transcriptional regulator [Balneicella halophila]
MHNDSSIPHYQKVIDFIINSAHEGNLSVGEKLPSLNSIAKTFQISRDTALAAYKIMKSKGIIKSVPGKGYFLSSLDFNQNLNVFILFDEFNSFKEDLYSSIIDNLGENATTDIYFHHFNITTFSQLINNSVGNYSHYIIMPCQFESVHKILSVLPTQRTYILDQSNTILNSIYSSVYQNFEEDIYNGLTSAKSLLNKYQKLCMIYPGGKEPKGQLNGFIKFCTDYDFPYVIFSSFNDTIMNKGNLYITPNDRYLIELVKFAKKHQWELGKDMGIISYNDTLLKEVVADGITTISTDFIEMGHNITKIIKENIKTNIHNPSSLIIRKSI